MLEKIENKIKDDYSNGVFTNHSHSLMRYIKENPCVKQYAEQRLNETPQYETVGKFLVALVEPKKALRKCLICGQYIGYTLNKNKHFKASFCCKKCAMTEEGIKIQVAKYKEKNPINPMKRPEVKEKHRQVMIDRYGVENPSLVPEFVDKRKQTCINLFGADNIFKTKSFSDRMKAKYKRGSSTAEREICNFIETLGFKVERNNRDILNGYEIDIVVPEASLCIEYDGLYWHSTAFRKNKNYHLWKTEQCEQRGYKLIHVFENEWRNDRSFVENVIKQTLGVIEMKKTEKDELLVDRRYWHERDFEGFTVVQKTPPRYFSIDSHGRIVQKESEVFKVWDCGFLRLRRLSACENC